MLNKTNNDEEPETSIKSAVDIASNNNNMHSTNNNTIKSQCVDTQMHASHINASIGTTPIHSYQNRPHHQSLFGHDYNHYLKNFVILSKLYSPQEYYSNIQLSQLPFINAKKPKAWKGSDCPSDISSIDSRRRRHHRKSKSSKAKKCLSWIRLLNEAICEFFSFLSNQIQKFRQWQKELHEAPLEVKEKYFFVISTIISTILFYILFLCLDVMIKRWFALPPFITGYSFSISYCISYLTSVVWQHFFNQYFVFSITGNSNNRENFCDSLFRTYLVYGCSLLITGIVGSLLQVYCGIADEFVLFVTLPISGIINYYLLRYCHQQNESYQYQLVATSKTKTKKTKTRHRHQKNKYNASVSNISYHSYPKHSSNVSKSYNKHRDHHHGHQQYTMDDIVIEIV